MITIKNIFLVEDEEYDQMFFVRAMRKIENAILQDVADNGKQALDKLETLEPLPDLIFMDVDMPVMDGMECLTEIKQREKLKNIPVVMLSNATEKAELTYALGARAFIHKPADPSLLHIKLAEIIALDF